MTEPRKPSPLEQRLTASMVSAGRAFQPWQDTPVASNKPELIEGAHADSLLYLVDEAKIVPDGT